MEAQNQVRYCLYARKSTESDERQTMSIDSQIKEMRAMAERDNLNIVELKQESHSAKLSGQRRVFNELLDDLRENKFNGVLSWAPDRLSRNAGDLGSLVDLMDQNKLRQIRTFGQSFSNTPNEKFLLMILCSQAKLENDNRGVNVKRGIRAKCEMGWRPCMPPLGYYNRAFNGVKDIVYDPERAPYIKEMFNRAALHGQSGRTIKRWLDANNFTTRAGKKVTLSQIYLMLKNPFYYGRFEYPKRSGNWYDGSHPKLISKDLFDIAQRRLIIPQKVSWGSKDFPFRRFLTCASCGSQIVGEEKTRHFNSGTVRTYVYYHCSRQVNYNCTEPYVREEAIIEELMRLSRSLIVRSSICEPGLSKAIARFASIMNSASIRLNHDEVVQGYAKYVLEKGTDFERARLVRNLDVDLELHNRTLRFVRNKA